MGIYPSPTSSFIRMLYLLYSSVNISTCLSALVSSYTKRLTHLQYLAAQSSNLPAVPPSGAVPSRRAWLETSFPPPTPYSQDLDDTNILRAQNHCLVPRQLVQRVLERNATDLSGARQFYFKHLT